MNRIFRTVSTFGVLAMSLFMWSCDNFGESTQPALTPAPMVVTSTSGTQFVVAVETSPTAGSNSAWINTSGGVVALGQHFIWVSPNAVSTWTKFTITRDPANALRVKLTAGRYSENDIGAAGFAAPVWLGLSYSNVSQVPADKSTMKLVYFRPDGLVEELSTQVNVYGLIAAAQVPHFSLFGLAWP